MFRDFARTTSTWMFAWVAACAGASSPASGPPATKLTPEAIQTNIRAHYREFHGCYEQGLSRNPKLAGCVAVRFSILTDGKVGDASDAGSSLPDPSVVQCIMHAYENISFAPLDTKVRVVYPLVFGPEGDSAAVPCTPSNEPSEAPLDSGASDASVCTLNFNSIPKTDIVVDDRAIGATPLLGLSVRSGSHTVLFTSGDVTKRVVVVCKPGESKTVVVRLR